MGLSQYLYQVIDPYRWDRIGRLRLHSILLGRWDIMHPGFTSHRILFSSTPHESCLGERRMAVRIVIA